MEELSIAKELRQVGTRLNEGSKSIFTPAKGKAETERDYSVALAREIMTLKQTGLPATIINDVARGNTADLKFNRDLADAKYSASREALQSLQAQASALQTIIKYHSEV
jgi:hypothetical protein